MMRPRGAEWVPRPLPRAARAIHAMLASNALDGSSAPCSARERTHTHAILPLDARAGTSAHRSIRLGRSPSLVRRAKNLKK